jgi:hypothetical protein
VGRGEKVFPLFLPLATKHGSLPLAIKHWSLSRFTKHWILPLATKHWSLSRATKHWNLPLATELGFSFISFLLLIFKMANSYHLALFFPEDNFLFNSWKHLFPQPSWVGKEWLVLVDGRKKENWMDVCSSFERKEVSKDNVGNSKFHKPF